MSRNVNRATRRRQRRSAPWGVAIAALVLSAGCAASASPPGSKPPPTIQGSPAASSARYSAPTTFASPLYRYSVTLPAGWLVIPAQATWDGAAPVGHDDPIVDQLIAPEVANRCRTVFACGPIAWALAAPTAKSLAALNADTDASEARDHPCPPTPESQDPTKIGGEAASLSAKHCPMDGGLLVLRAIAIHKGVAYYFWLQDPANEREVEPLDRADFDALIAAVRLPD